MTFFSSIRSSQCLIVSSSPLRMSVSMAGSEKLAAL